MCFGVFVNGDFDFFGVKVLCWWEVFVRGEDVVFDDVGVFVDFCDVIVGEEVVCWECILDFG